MQIVRGGVPNGATKPTGRGAIGHVAARPVLAANGRTVALGAPSAAIPANDAKENAVVDPPVSGTPRPKSLPPITPSERGGSPEARLACCGSLPPIRKFSTGPWPLWPRAGFLGCTDRALPFRGGAGPLVPGVGVGRRNGGFEQLHAGTRRDGVACLPWGRRANILLVALLGLAPVVPPAVDSHRPLLSCSAFSAQ